MVWHRTQQTSVHSSAIHPTAWCADIFSALAWHKAEVSIDSAAVGRSSSPQAAARGLAAVGKRDKWQGLQGRNHRAARGTSHSPSGSSLQVWCQALPRLEEAPGMASAANSSAGQPEAVWPGLLPEGM